MASTSSVRQIVLHQRPTGRRLADGDLVFQTVPADELQAPLADGELRVRLLWLSVDPYMRPKMTNLSRESYTAPYEVGKPMAGGAVAQVEESRSELYKPGDLVQGFLPWQERGVRVAAAAVEPVPAGLDRSQLSHLLGVLGPVVGCTAVRGVHEFGRATPGHAVLVSGAAGAVGSLAGQMAALHGCRAIGVAGSADKCRLAVRECRFTACVDYNTLICYRAQYAAGAESPAARAALTAAEAAQAVIGVEQVPAPVDAVIADGRAVDALSDWERCKVLTEVLRRLEPGGVEVYFDNVGGWILDAALAAMEAYGRIVAVGSISHYNTTPDNGYGLRNTGRFVMMRLRMEGFIVLEAPEKYAALLQQLGELLRAGRIHAPETVVEGFDRAPAALAGLFSGENTGKMVVHVSDALSA